MTYYHGSPQGGLTILCPKETLYFKKPRQVCMTTLLPMALLYLVRHFEYTYGYTKDGQLYYEEYFPDALLEIYGGKAGWLYSCEPKDMKTTAIPKEVVSDIAVPVKTAVYLPDVYAALQEQAALGRIRLITYENLSDASRDWIIKAEAQEIRSRRLWEEETPMAGYYRRHYPQGWELACAEEI